MLTKYQKSQFLSLVRLENHNFFLSEQMRGFLMMVVVKRVAAAIQMQALQLLYHLNVRTLDASSHLMSQRERASLAPAMAPSIQLREQSDVGPLLNRWNLPKSL